MKANFIPTKMCYALCDAEGNPINNKIFEDIELGENYIAFKSNDKWGMLDEDGNILHAAEFDDIRDAVGEYIIVEKTNNNGYRRYGILNKNAQVVIPIKYVGIGYVKNLSGCIYWICKNDNLLEGVYDEQFNNILPEEYNIRYNSRGLIVLANKENIVFFNYNLNEIKGYGKDYGDDFGYQSHLIIKTKNNYTDIFLVGNYDDKNLKALYYNTDKEKIDMITIPNINTKKFNVIDIGVSIIVEKKDGYFNIYTFDYIANKLIFKNLRFEIRIKNVLYYRYGKYLILRDEKNGWCIIDPSDNFKIVSKFPNLPKFMCSYMFEKVNINFINYEYVKID